MSVMRTCAPFRGSTWEEVLEVYVIAERGLLLGEKWFDQNLLTIKLQKTKCMPTSLKFYADPVGRKRRFHTYVR